MAAEPKAGYGKSDYSPEKKRRDQNDRKGKCFLVPADEIRANKYDLSISRYKEIEHKEIEYEKPTAIMEKVMSLESEITKDIEEIKKML